MSGSHKINTMPRELGEKGFCVVIVGMKKTLVCESWYNSRRAGKTFFYPLRIAFYWGHLSKWHWENMKNPCECVYEKEKLPWENEFLSLRLAPATLRLIIAGKVIFLYILIRSNFDLTRKLWFAFVAIPCSFAFADFGWWRLASVMTDPGLSLLTLHVRSNAFILKYHWHDLQLCMLNINIKRLSCKTARPELNVYLMWWM